MKACTALLASMAAVRSGPTPIARKYREVVASSSSRLEGYLSNLGVTQEELQHSNNIPMFWFQEVSSTMDTSRELLRSNELNCQTLPLFGVLTKSQTVGRGTRGRKWIEGSGNLFLTLVFHKRLLPTAVPLTLVPLRIGSLLHPIVVRRVSSEAEVHLKWPNDLLVNNKKVSGILIEIEDENLLVGIGINVMTAPRIPGIGAAGDSNDGEDDARPSTSIYDQQNSPPQVCNSEGEGSNCSEQEGAFPSHQDAFIEGIAVENAEAVSSWLLSVDLGDQIVADFSALMVKSNQKLRSSTGTHQAGAEVTPIKVNSDGSLQVRFLLNGTEESLFADYLW